MATTVTIRDETTGGEQTNELSVDLLTSRVTIRELIRSRVHQEVKDYNRSSPGYFRGLVQPKEAEKVLNGYKLQKQRRIDWEEQFERALEAFQKNGFFVLLDNHQAESLDEEIEITPDTRVTFVKLVPLVGG